MKSFFLAILIFCAGFAYSINTDSLETVLPTLKGEAKIKVLNDLCWFLGGVDRAKAEKYGSQALELAFLNKNDTILAQSYNDFGTLFLRYGDYDSATALYEKSMVIRKELKDTSGLASVISKLAVIHELKGEYSTALKYDLEVLKIYDDLESKLNISMVKNNIAIIYYHLDQLELAKKFNKEALRIANELDNKKHIQMILTTFGNISLSENKIDSAIYFTSSALTYADMNMDLNNKSILLNNLASMYLNRDELELAEKAINESLEIRKNTDDLKGLSSSNSMLARLLVKQEKYKEALFVNDKAYDFAIQVGALENKKAAIENYVNIYGKLKNHEKTAIYLEELLLVSDSLKNDNFSQQMVEMETKYESEKKDSEIKLLNKENALEKEKVQRQRFQLYGTGIGIFLLLLLSLTIFISYSQKKKANETITQQNEELNQYNEEILAQRDEIEDQKNVIEEKHSELQSSISYAKRIQTALLTTDEHWNNISPEHFILFQPRDVVSGDFFWAYATNKVAIWVAADCTGHGVPGAFMSMLGVSFLNEIVAEQGESEADKILNKLREKIIKSLEQKGVETQQRDGMDIALCVWDKDKSSLQYAGAYNPLFIIRNENGVKELIELKADKQPIGKLIDLNEPFHSKNFDLKKGDMLYTFSDGYSDQFGGMENKKFGKRRFKELLLNISEDKMKDQHDKLAHNIESWKEQCSAEQIDDICVVGVKIV